MKAFSVVSAVVTVAFCAGSLSAQTISQNFPGVKYNDVLSLGTAGTPPDSMGAAGPSQFVEFVNGAFAIYSKTGTRQSMISDRQFWINAGITTSVVNVGLTDPRITFDPTVNRWFATEVNFNSTSNQVLVARSNTADPAGTWKGINYTGVSGQFADYDTLGVDATNVYIGSNNFTSSTGNFTGVTVTAIPKADLLAATPSLTNMKQFVDTSAKMGDAPRGVTNYSTNPGHGVIIATDDIYWQTTDRTTVNGSGLSASLGSTTRIATTYDVANGPIAALQLGGTKIDVVDNRYTGAITQVGDKIYAASTVKNGAHDAVRWLVLSESTNAVVGEGVIFDPNYDFFQPSIGVNANGTFLLGFNRVGTTAGTGNVSIYGAVGTTNGDSVTVSAPFLIRQGTVANFIGPSYDTGTEKRWGDYSATTVDPSDPNTFWTIQEIPVSATEWGTQITAVTVPEPSTFALLVAGLLGLVVYGWRRRRS